MNEMSVCPCRVNHKERKAYKICCGPLHNHGVAENAEVLMRSRYSAFVLELAPYLRETWHSSTRPNDITFDEQPKQKWLGLDIKQHEQVSENEAYVEFVARYTVGGRAYRLHEKSRFIKEDHQWKYIDGEFK